MPIGKSSYNKGDKVLVNGKAGEVTNKVGTYYDVMLDDGTTIKTKIAAITPADGGETVTKDTAPAADKKDKPAKADKKDKPVTNANAALKKAVERKDPAPKSTDAKAGGDIFPEGTRKQYEKYKPAKGKVRLDCGDGIAVALRGLEVPDFIKVAGKLLEGETEATLKSKYGHLNNGQQRMTIGVRVRKAPDMSAAKIAKVRKELGLTDK